MRCRQRQQESGAIAVLAAIVLMVVAGFLALSLNVGFLMNSRAQLQGAADAAALAGVRSLDGTAAGLAAAHDVAREVAIRHNLGVAQIAISANAGNVATGDVVVGYRDGAGTFFSDGQTPTIGDATIQLDPTLTPQFYNAVRVRTAADGGVNHNGMLPIFMGPIIGAASTFATQTSATALGGGPCDEDRMVLPMVVAACAIADPAGNTLCGQTVTLTFDGVRAKFADVEPPSEVIEEDEVRVQFDRAREGNSPSLPAFTTIATNTGAGYGATAQGAAQSLACTGSGCPFYALPIVNTGTACTGTIPTNARPVGFAQVTVQSVNWGASPRTFQVVISCTATNPLQRESNRPGGCSVFGFLPGIRGDGAARARLMPRLTK